MFDEVSRKGSTAPSGDADRADQRRIGRRLQPPGLLGIEDVGADAGLAGGIEGVEPDALDGAAARDHHKVLMVREFARQQHGRHALALLERQDIDDVRAARRAPGLRDEVALLAVDAARVREEQDIVVRRGDEEILDVVSSFRLWPETPRPPRRCVR